MNRRNFPVGPPIAVAPEPPSVPGHSNPLRDNLRGWLAALELREAVRHDLATLVSLERTCNLGRHYVLLHDAIAAGSAIVSEQGAGNVNVLAVTNKGAEPVLLLEGEIVAGAKQNRTVTETLLVPPGATVPVQVGCVERGRWDAARQPFASSPHAMETNARRETAREMASVGHLDQARLWTSVEKHARHFDHRSPTSDYLGAADKAAADVSKLVRKVPESDTRVGMMLLFDGHFLGLDVVGHPRTWGSLAPRLVPSYFTGLDVLAAHPEMLPDNGRATQAEWLGAVTLGPVLAAPTAGLGERVLVRSAAMNGAGLWHDGHPAHLAVFAD